MGPTARLLCASFALASVASAQESVCAPLTEDDFLDSIAAAHQALLDEDVDAHERVMTGLQARVSCFAFIPKPEQWANLLVGASIVDHATGQPWEAKLATALAIHPRVNRMVGSRHPLAKWEPPPAPATTGQEAPEGVRIYFDGELVTEVPAASGYHLAQRRTGDGLVSVLLIDEPIPADWLVVPELGVAVDLGWGFAGVAAGGAGTSLSVDSPGTYLTDGGTIGAAIGLDVHGLLRFGEGFGLRYGVSAGVAPAFGFDALLGASKPIGPLDPWVGVVLGTDSINHTDGASSVFLAAPALGVGMKSGQIGTNVRVAAAPWVIQAQAAGSYAFSEGPVAPFLGATIDFRQLMLSQGDERKLSQGHWTAGLRVGLAWGGAQ